MEWSATTITESSHTQQKSFVLQQYIFKLNALPVLRTERTHIPETVNHAAQNHPGYGHFKPHEDTSAEPTILRVVKRLNSARDLTNITLPQSPLLPEPQTYLTAAREVLNRKKKLAESQEEDFRMCRKRKINDEGVEIRKTIDRPTKRQCDEKTRDLGLFSELEIPLTCEIKLETLQACSIITSNRRLFPLLQAHTEALTLYAYHHGEDIREAKVSASTCKSPLSECFTAVV